MEMGHKWMGGYVSVLQRALSDESGTRTRALLARGDTTAGRIDAQMILLSFGISPFRLEAVTLHASLIARNSHHRDTYGYPLGRIARGLSHSEDTVRRTMSALQRQPLDIAHKTFRGWVEANRSGNEQPISFEQTLWTYLKWDKEAPFYPTRRKLILDYFGDYGSTSKATDNGTPIDDKEIENDNA